MKLPEKQRLLDDHFKYEIEMLRGTYLEIGSQHDQIVRNAVIESFYIHARQLLEFFNNKQGARVKDFSEPTFAIKHIVSIPKKTSQKLNTQVAHLTDMRTSVESDKLADAEQEMICEYILLEAANFSSHLLSGLTMPSLDFTLPSRSKQSSGPTGATGPTGGPRPSATNAIQTT